MSSITESSYRALFAIPRLGRVILSMQIARIAQSMVSVALVLFVLGTYGDPALAGIVTFASIVPGLLLAPVAGALLDRHGRRRMIMLDYIVALASLVLVGVLALADALPATLLVAITMVSSVTGILSHTGMRSLFPILVPSHLWERVNAVDSNGYVVATILGPPIAAAMVASLGGATTLIAIGLAFGVAALALIGAPDPATDTASSGHLLRDAWHGVVYTWRNRTLRGLGFSIATLNIATGMTTILIPLIVVERLDGGAAAVGLVFAASGLTGLASTFLFGRVDTRDREWSMLFWPTILFAPTFALLLVAAGASDVAIGLGVLVLMMGLVGFLAGPLDIALFTVRQRRTDQAWMGRAFAVSMAFNYVGVPIGAAIAGILATSSLDLAVIVGIVAALAAAALVAAMIPRRDPGPVSAIVGPTAASRDGAQ